MADLKPPVTTPEVRLAYSDEFGPVWADSSGYLYRGPEYRARYNALAQQPGYVGDWEDMTFAFRTYKAVPQWRNSFLKLAQYVATASKPVGDAVASAELGSTLRSAALPIGALAALVYFFKR